MMKTKLIVCLILMVVILTSCEYSLNDEVSAANGVENTITQEADITWENNDISKTVQEERKELTISNITNVDLGKIDSIEICKRNIEEESTCVLNETDAYDFAKKLINIKLKKFNKKEYNPITGGDEFIQYYWKAGKALG